MVLAWTAALESGKFFLSLTSSVRLIEFLGWS